MKLMLMVMCLLLVLSLQAACTFEKSKATAENAVTRFHDEFNAEMYHEIYGQTDEGFRKVTTEGQLTDLLKAVHSKLGVVKDAKQTAWRVNATTSGTLASFTYDTTFAEAQATEQFVFIVSGGTSTLLKYNIQSPALVIK